MLFGHEVQESSHEFRIMSSSTSTTQKASTAWHAIDAYWQGGEDVVAAGLSHDKLAPAWQVMLLGDGSPTRHLSLLSGAPVKVELVEMKNIGMEEDGAPELVSMIPGPRIRRQVFLKSNSGQPLLYGCSWWEAKTVDEYLADKAVPIWTSLSMKKTELRRDVQAVFCGHSLALEEAFAHAGPLWGRYYLFWKEGKPLTLIYEVMSPTLSHYLGPTMLPPAGMKALGQ